MNQDEIIEMAQQCGLIGMRPHLDGIYSEALEAFAKLVAAKEREFWIEQVKVDVEEAVRDERLTCLKIAESMSLIGANMNKTWRTGCRDVAESIRARGEA